MLLIQLTPILCIFNLAVMIGSVAVYFLHSLGVHFPPPVLPPFWLFAPHLVVLVSYVLALIDNRRDKHSASSGKQPPDFLVVLFLVILPLANLFAISGIAGFYILHSLGVRFPPARMPPFSAFVPFLVGGVLVLIYAWFVDRRDERRRMAEHAQARRDAQQQALIHQAKWDAISEELDNEELS
jgi:hypothetical protein